MMHLTCPNCGETLPSENINIQQMAAVCPACDTVFQFSPPRPKAKHRKVKQPQHLSMQENNDVLSLAFRTNFRLDQKQDFIGVSVMSAAFTFVTLSMLGGAIAADVPIFMAGSFGLVVLFLYYVLALIVYNKTHIEMDDDQITVSRRPLPNIFRQPDTISLHGVEAIRYEETPTSKKEGYDTPRYRVWAEMVDGHRRTVVSDVTQEYAIFITQRLNERLAEEAEVEMASLLADEPEAIEDEGTADPFSQDRQYGSR
jgi:DNA-directed RNA polymerase subunit M/transcription elongation factor TFIIS